MTHKYLIKTILLSMLIVPAIGFAAEPAQAKNNKIENTDDSEVILVSKDQADKNRKERINHALDALYQNISNVEKAVNQSLARAGGIDKKSKGIDMTISELGKEKAKLAEIKAKVASTKEEIKTIDTTNKDQIKAMSEKLQSIKMEIRNEINAILVQVKSMKTLPLAASASSTPKVIQKTITTPNNK